MNGADLVVDTNILIYITGGNKQIAEATRGKNLIISFVTEMELRSWPALTQESTSLIQKLLSQCRIVSLNDEIKEKAIEIRKKTKLKLPIQLCAQLLSI
jgi:predicted nucleic acid-binding protein